jgi:hypothetical protein
MMGHRMNNKLPFEEMKHGKSFYGDLQLYDIKNIPGQCCQASGLQINPMSVNRNGTCHNLVRCAQK